MGNQIRRVRRKPYLHPFYLAPILVKVGPACTPADPSGGWFGIFQGGLPHWFSTTPPEVRHPVLNEIQDTLSTGNIVE